MARRDRPDFIQVQLSPAGLAHAGDGATLRIVTGHMHYLFVGTDPVEVLRFAQWPTLQRHVDAEGQPFFQAFEPVSESAPAEAEANQLQEG